MFRHLLEIAIYFTFYKYIHSSSLGVKLKYCYVMGEKLELTKMLGTKLNISET